MSDSIFTQIIKGEVPAFKLYEDSKTLAFLDIHPVQPGHTLVISKKQVEFVWDLEDDDYQAVMATTKKVARHLRKTLGTKYVGQRIVGVDVPHAHVQLIPFDTPEQWHHQTSQDDEPDFAALEVMFTKLKMKD